MKSSYQSRTESSSDQLPKAPGKTLANWAIWLAVIFGVSPVGADFLFAAYRADSSVNYILLALFFFGLISAPLVLLFAREGRAAFAVAPIRITVSCLIVILYVVLNVSAILELFLRAVS